MSVVDHDRKEITAKLVYYGPSFSGRTTSLQYLFRSAPPTERTGLVSATHADYRDISTGLRVPSLAVPGFSVLWRVHTIPPSTYPRAGAKGLLTGSDGVIFVVDSRAEHLPRNHEAIAYWRSAANEVGVLIDELPLVLQYNQRDQASALPIEVLDIAFNPRGAPAIPSTAKTGAGVREAFEACAGLVHTELLRSRERGA